MLKDGVNPFTVLSLTNNEVVPLGKTAVFKGHYLCVVAQMC